MLVLAAVMGAARRGDGAFHSSSMQKLLSSTYCEVRQDCAFNRSHIGLG
jgi:hypothetical protein